jgi:hypothetical protein
MKRQFSLETTLFRRLAMASMMLIIGAGAAVAVPTTGHPQVPLKGTIQADEVHNHTSATTAVITGSGTGIASHLGKFSLTYSLDANLAALTETGSGTLIAANGDSIYVTITGSAAPSAPGVLAVNEVWTITGGTGRFAGARGSFAMDRQDYYLEVPIVTSGSFVGTIQVEGAGR